MPLRSILTVICKIMIMDNVTGMSIQEYAAMRELECEHKKGWGATAAIWVIAAVIVIAFFVYSWHNNCNEKVQFAVGFNVRINAAFSSDKKCRGPPRNATCPRIGLPQASPLIV